MVDLEICYARMLADLAEAHQRDLSEMSDSHQSVLAQQTSAHATTLQHAKDAHSQALKQSVETLANAELSHKRTTQELAEARSVLATMTSEKEKEQEHLKREMAGNSEKQSEIERLERSLEGTKKSESSLNHELQEALDALGTLEKALVESQDERETLMDDIHELRKRSKRNSVIAADLSNVVRERDSLKAEIKRLEVLVEEFSTPSMQGLGINGLPPSDLKSHDITSAASSASMQRASSSTSELETFIDASPIPLGPTVGSSVLSPNLPHAHSSAARYSSVMQLMSSSHSSMPPPTPPPSHPPPPLPTDALFRSTASKASTTINGSSISNIPHPTHSSVSSSIRHRASLHTQDSSQSETQATSQRTDSQSMDTVDVEEKDARLQQKLEEQEGQMKQLNKQLQHCETELSANIDLVQTLESALSDYERNMRKTRLQMNELAKERDDYIHQNDQLRIQMQDTLRQADTARHSLHVHEEEQKMKMEAQRKAQTEAQRNAELRMQELQRLNRRSKFNVGSPFI